MNCGSTNMITLSDGVSVTQTLADIVYGCLIDLADTNPEALTALVKKCQDNARKLFDPNLGVLVQINLATKAGEVREEISAIVKSMAEGQVSDFQPRQLVPNTEKV